MIGEGNQRKGEIESRYREREIKVNSNTQEGDKQTTRKKDLHFDVNENGHK